MLENSQNKNLKNKLDFLKQEKERLTKRNQIKF